MVQIQAKNISLRDLIDQFNLTLVEDEEFFWEWQDNLPEITDLEQQHLDRIKAGYLNLLNYSPLLENAVKLTVLAPLLYFADFYLPPFRIEAEKSIELVDEDEGVLIRGRLDILVLKEGFWVMVIESKQASYSIEAGLAQLLAYMLANPNSEKPGYGMITTGGTFIFVKLLKGETAQYALSNPFDLRRRGNDLYQVLCILKHLAEVSA